MRRHLLRVCLMCGLLAGCSQERQNASYFSEAANVDTAAMAADGEFQDAANPALPAASDNQVERRIIYIANIMLVVPDLSKLETTVPGLVQQFGGYLADVSIDSTQGEYRTSRWTARVPVDRFEAFLTNVANLGVPESQHRTAQDVTEEFVDLEARISNKKQLEQRIVELLEKSVAELKDVIAVEQELARVRGEIEQMEGRRRYLINRTSLTTVTITAREQKNYVPPQAPTYTTRVTDAWSSSLTSLREFGEETSIAIVAIFPWLCVLAVILLPLAWYVRRHAGTRPR